MLREIQLSDAVSLREINAKQLGYDVPLELTQQQLKKMMTDAEHHYFLVYEDEETKKAVGYIHAEVYATIYSDTLFNVLSLAVDGDYHKQGIGKKLIFALEKEAAKRHYAAIRLNSGEARKEAHKFYENIGYTMEKYQKKFWKSL